MHGTETFMMTKERLMHSIETIMTTNEMLMHSTEMLMYSTETFMISNEMLMNSDEIFKRNDETYTMITGIWGNGRIPVSSPFLFPALVNSHIHLLSNNHATISHFFQHRRDFLQKMFNLYRIINDFNH